MKDKKKAMYASNFRMLGLSRRLQNILFGEEIFSTVDLESFLEEKIKERDAYPPSSAVTSLLCLPNMGRITFKELHTAMTSNSPFVSRRLSKWFHDVDI